MTDSLVAIAEDIERILPLFIRGRGNSGLFLDTAAAAKFKALVVDAKVMMDEELGPRNEYSRNLVHAVNSGSGGFVGGPSYASVEESVELVRAAARAISRRSTNASKLPAHGKPYVDPGRLESLRSAKDTGWDYSRLIELCREINVTSSADCHMATAMILRAILDHVAPIFGFNNFIEVSNNYSGSSSFKKSMKKLNESLRNIADSHLHTKIRKREMLPTFTQVDFSADLDVLLGEIIRISGGD